MLVLDKPEGITSMRAVEILRRLAGKAKAGHAGTLDPLATGILLVCFGRATKSISLLMNCDKRYETTIDCSATTSTLDREGARHEVEVKAIPSESAVREALAANVGTIMQRPPAFSAIKIGGQRSYKLARASGGVDDPAAAEAAAAAIEPRAILVHSMTLLKYEWPFITVAIHCGKGFYVRSLARDLGKALGCGGYCTAIRRTAIGRYDLSAARSLDSLSCVTAADLLPACP